MSSDYEILRSSIEIGDKQMPDNNSEDNDMVDWDIVMCIGCDQLEISQTPPSKN